MSDVNVVVVGGGHAGTEAAAAAARMGASVALVTQRLDTIGAMSCNPSIGGVGKGHIVREIDALDGLMARAADAAAIHHRLLNSSKGAAVQGPRVQADRTLYAAAVKKLLGEHDAIATVAGEVAALLSEGGRVTGVRLDDGQVVRARAVVLATGTFLGGRLFQGEERSAGGRLSDRPATALADQLRGEGFAVARLKTGTPPRLDARSIDWARLSPQPSDDANWTMSTLSTGRTLPQLACAITRTNEVTHSVVREGLGTSPLSSGAIEGKGPRYCPSIEDKIARFGDRDGHQVFLEPEGLGSSLVYPNGISTSLSADIQERFVRSIAGLERAQLATLGYAVEYDYLDPRQLDRTLQSRLLTGLYCAGQINGTTGYEEAAGQGLVAGVNAAAAALGRAPLLLDRADSYLGVMIDDLVLQGVSEPYRMLTARAEFRLSLRADNAEARLGAAAAAVGCLSTKRLEHQARRQEWRSAIADRLLEPVAAGALGLAGSDRHPLSHWIIRGEADADLIDGPGDLVAEMVATTRYAPYVDRQRAEVERLRADEAIALPADLRYEAVPGLSNEMIERLNASRPDTLGAAGRLRGITPAALSAVLLYVRRWAA